MPQTYDLSRKREDKNSDSESKRHTKGRVPPHNNEAERAVLGAMLSSPDAVGAAAEIIDSNDFYVGLHANIFDAILKLYNANEPVDVITLADKLRTDGQLEAVGGLAFLRGLTADVLSPARCEYYAKIVRENATRRGLIATAVDIIDLAHDADMETTDLVEHAESSVFAVAEHKVQSNFTIIGDLLDDEVERLSQMHKDGVGVVGLATGFHDFDLLTAGLQPSNLVIVAARPGMGKSTFMANVAAHVAIRERRPVAFFTLEMSKEEVVQRVMCSEARIKASHMKNGKLNDDDWAKLMNGVHTLHEVPLYIEDSGQTTLMDIRTKARRLASQSPDGLGLVVVDYMQLMHTPGRSESRQVEIAEISRGLKVLARELGCPVIVASQLNRSPESRSDKRPMLGDLRESGSIEQDADIVTFLYRDDYYNKESDALGEAELIVAKHRNGPTDTIKLLFLEHQSRFENYAFGVA